MLRAELLILILWIKPFGFVECVLDRFPNLTQLSIESDRRLVSLTSSLLLLLLSLTPC